MSERNLIVASIVALLVVMLAGCGGAVAPGGGARGELDFDPTTGNLTKVLFFVNDDCDLDKLAYDPATHAFELNGLKRKGSTLGQIQANGVVAINQTWAPVVDDVAGKLLGYVNVVTGKFVPVSPAPVSQPAPRSPKK